MKELLITKPLFDFLENVEEYYGQTWGMYIDLTDVLFTYFNETKDGYDYFLNDWDEGKNNDNNWDEERDCCSEYSYIKDLCSFLDKYREDPSTLETATPLNVITNKKLHFTS